MSFPSLEAQQWPPLCSCLLQGGFTSEHCEMLLLQMNMWNVSSLLVEEELLFPEQWAVNPFIPQIPIANHSGTSWNALNICKSLGIISWDPSWESLLGNTNLVSYGSFGRPQEKRRRRRNQTHCRFHELGLRLLIVSVSVRACVLSVCTYACCFATHIWSGPKNQRLWLSNIALRFPNLRQLATVSRRWFIGWREGHFPSQSHRTFMVCSHPNLLQINLSPGSVWASAVSADNRQVCARARTHANAHKKAKSVFPDWEREPDWTKFWNFEN